jgi:orotidine-5'-phosphate decarboxylase
MPLDPREKIIAALDVRRAEDAYPLIEQFAPHITTVKIGLGLITSGEHRAVISRAHNYRMKVFLDGKFNDTPRTVADAAQGAADLGVWMFSIHVAGGGSMMAAAMKHRGDALVIGVTVLTSLSDGDGNTRNRPSHIFGARAAKKVITFANDAFDAGLHGITCSPKELPLLAKKEYFDELLFVVPGIRPIWAPARGQRRMGTPVGAFAAGANYEVIGSPITKPPRKIGTPADALQRIIATVELAGASPQL